VRTPAVARAEDWVPLPGALKAIARATQAGWRVLVITNQPGLGEGLFDIHALNQIHRKMHGELAKVGGMVEAVFFCPHAPGVGCLCRKPGVGLLREAASRLKTTLRGVPLVGDDFADLQAAQAVEASPILVRTGNGEGTLESHRELADVRIFPDLAEAVDHLLAAASIANAAAAAANFAHLSSTSSGIGGDW